MYSIVNGRAIATAQVNDRKFGLRTLGWTAINWERVEKARNICTLNMSIYVWPYIRLWFLAKEMLVAFIISLALMLLHSICVWVWYNVFFSLSFRSMWKIVLRIYQWNPFTVSFSSVHCMICSSVTAYFIAFGFAFKHICVHLATSFYFIIGKLHKKNVT